jgi:hypothetical protein
MILGTLENDANKGDGWALLKVPLIDAEGTPVKSVPGPGESYCLVSVKDMDGERFLQNPASETHWDSQEIFYQVPLESQDGNVLSLRIPPDITDHMQSNFFSMTVKCEAGAIPEVMVQASDIARRSDTSAADENYARTGPGASVVAWIHKEGEGGAKGPSWLDSAEPDDLAQAPRDAPEAPGQDGGFEAGSGYGDTSPYRDDGGGGADGGFGSPTDLPPPGDQQSPFFTPADDDEAARAPFEVQDFGDEPAPEESYGEGQQPWEADSALQPYQEGYQEGQQQWDGQQQWEGQQQWDAQQQGYGQDGQLEAYAQPAPPAEIPEPPKKSGKLPLILVLLFLLLLGGGAFYYFKVYKKDAPPVADAGDREPPVDAPISEPPVAPGGGGPEAPPAAPSGPAQAAQHARGLLDRGASPDQISAVVKDLEGSDDPEVVSVLFEAVRELAKYDPEFRVRLGAFYDPLDPRPSSVQKNAGIAWEEYTEASGAGATGARAPIRALRDWANSPAAESDPEGAAQIRAATPS